MGALLPPGREHAQHHHQLLHQGRGDRVPARPRDPQGHQQLAVARRPNEAGLRALLGSEGLHVGRVPCAGLRGGRRRPVGVASHGARYHQRAGLRRPRVARSPVQARTGIDQGVGGPDDGHTGRDASQRQRPPRRGAGAPGHTGFRRGRERGGRDRRHWRVPRAAGPVGGALAGLQARRQGAASGRAPRAVVDARRHARRRAAQDVAARPDPAASDAAKARLAGWLKP